MLQVLRDESLVLVSEASGWPLLVPRGAGLDIGSSWGPLRAFFCQSQSLRRELYHALHMCHH